MTIKQGLSITGLPKCSLTNLCCKKKGCYPNKSYTSHQSSKNRSQQLSVCSHHHLLYSLWLIHILIFNACHASYQCVSLNMLENVKWSVTTQRTEENTPLKLSPDVLWCVFSSITASF